MLWKGIVFYTAVTTRASIKLLRKIPVIIKAACFFCYIALSLKRPAMQAVHEISERLTPRKKL